MVFDSWDHYVDARNFATMWRILSIECAVRRSLDITPPKVVNQAVDSAVDRAVVEAVNDDIPTLWGSWVSFE